MGRHKEVDKKPGFSRWTKRRMGLKRAGLIIAELNTNISLEVGEINEVIT